MGIIGIKELINQHRGISAAIALAVLLIAIVILFMQAGDSPSVRSGPPKDWYTIDDGKTWFADAANKFPPFECQGKTAYRCRVWTCDDGKTKFISHLERYSVAVKKKLESMNPKDIGDSFEVRIIEVKAPLTGDQGWIDIKNPGADAICSPKCPNGSSEGIRPVMPD